MSEEQKAPEQPYLENPLLHQSDHDLSQRIDWVRFESENEQEYYYEAGRNKVASIWQRSPAIAGEIWYIDIVFVDGSVKRKFSPAEINYRPAVPVVEEVTEAPPEDDRPEMVVDLGEQSS